MEPYMFGGNVALGVLLVATSIAIVFCMVMLMASRRRGDDYEPIEHEPPADRAVTRVYADFITGKLP